MAKLPKLQADLLAAIRASKWRGEASLCREFDKEWTAPIKVARAYADPSLARSPKVEDALFALVKLGKVEWFGGGESGDEPLKYRAVTNGR